MDLQWIERFKDEAQKETNSLAENGATCQVEARNRLMTQLLKAYTDAENETLTVDEAAEATGVHPETVRRALRSGLIPDNRTSKKQSIVVPKSALPTLAARRRKKRDRSALVKHFTK